MCRFYNINEIQIMTYIEQLRSTLTDLESRLSKAGIDDTDTYHSINNSRIAIDELEKMVIIDGVIDSNEGCNGEPTPLIDDLGRMTCNCKQPKPSMFPTNGGTWVCIKCWGLYYR